MTEESEAPAAGSFLVIPEVVLQRLTRYFKLEAVERIMHLPAELFGGVSPLDYVRAGHAWDEVVAKYDVLFSYAVGP